MTPVNQQHDDTKILLTVAGVVVAGAAALAFFAGMEESQPEATQATARQVQPASHGETGSGAEVAEPAMFFDRAPGTEAVIETASIAKVGGSTVPEIADLKEVEVEVDPASELASIDIAPGEDLVAEGLRAWSSREYIRAAAYFRAQTEARDSDAWAHYMTGLSLWKAGLGDQAVGSMERALELDPTFIRTPINLSRIQNDRGDYDAALKAALTAVTIDPNEPQARFLEGRSLNNLERTEEAIEALQTSIELSDTNGYVHNLLGWILLTEGDAVAAADVLERAAELEPNVAFVHNNLGMALEHCGEREAALVAYQRAVELNGDFEKAVNNVARLEPTVSTPASEALASATPETEREEPEASVVATADSRSLD